MKDIFKLLRKEPVAIPNKDTMIFGSFSSKPGNIGAQFFNTYFKKNKINAIYIPFKANSLEEILYISRVLNMRGFGVSSPFKKEIYEYIKKYNNLLQTNPRNSNTVICKPSYFDFNTDVLAIEELLRNKKYKLMNAREFVLFGTNKGAYFESWKYVLSKLCLSFSTKDYGRFTSNEGMGRIPKDCITVNCTPRPLSFISMDENHIDCSPYTRYGSILARLQAEWQLSHYSRFWAKSEQI